MTRPSVFWTAATCATVMAASLAQAQPRTGWMMEASGAAAYQGEADLSGGGDVAVTRSFLRFGGLYRFEGGTAAGLSLGVGHQSFDFGGGIAPLWDDVHSLRLSVPVRFDVGATGQAIVAPQVRSAHESGAGGSDSTTYGVFAGVSWQVSDSLRLGPAFGAFSKLESSGVDAFPALLVDWQINDRWSFGTGSGLAATRGPGLRLSYAYSDALDLGLGVRLEQSEFRLDETGLAPGGVGEDRSIPVVISLDYNPNPGVSVSGFVGAAFDGELTVEDARGVTIRKESYDTAPVAGLAARLRF